MVSASLRFSPRFQSRLRTVKLRYARKLLAGLLMVSAIGFAAIDFYRPDHGSMKVLTAARQLSPGSVIGSADYAVAHIPRDLVPAGALSDAQAVKEKTLAGPMSKGEVFVGTRFVGPELADALTGMENSKIVAVKPAESGIVSVLQVGDVVDIVAASDGENNAAPIATGARVASTGETDIVFLALPAGAAEIVASINIATPITLVLSR